MQKSMIDRLMDMCDERAPEIAELWFKALSSNPRSNSCCIMPKEGLTRHAVNIYHNLAKMYFADDCYGAVEHMLDVSGFAEDFFARGIPLEDVIYALVLLRRYIWLYADSQAIFRPDAVDLWAAVQSINRTILIFDYASHVTINQYRDLAAKQAKSITASIA